MAESMTGAPGGFIGVDVGGTKVLAVRLAANGAVEATTTRPMPGRTAAEAELDDVIDAAVRSVAGPHPPLGIGLSAAGLVDRAGQRYLFGAHLPWRDTPVRERMAARWRDLGRPRVVLDNDANCAAYAETVLGAARGRDSALIITLGTGIGGAIVIGGRLWRGAHGLAGEFGHMQLVPDGLACECGLQGCWEQYCSGRALERLTRVALGRHRDGPEVTAMALAGDPRALRAFAGIGSWLGIGVAALISAFDPEVVIIGGGLSSVGELLLEPAAAAIATSLQGTAHRPVPPLEVAALGPEAGAVGAALLARDAGPDRQH